MSKIKIENLTFDLDLLARRLRQDLKDDWFPDPLNHEDLLISKVIKEKFKGYIANPSKRYAPSKSEQFNIPKKGFTLRYSLVTSLLDRLMYQGIAGILISHLDHAIPNCVYSHRKAPQKNSKYIFQHPVKSWMRFEGDIAAELDGTKKVLLVTDVQNYYENIRFADIRKAILFNSKKMGLKPSQLKNIKCATNLLIKLLRKWEQSKGVGIPQNRDASSFLGNMLLCKLDTQMVKKGYSYFRYMDDIRVVCDNVYQARRILKEIIIDLRRIGLNVNAQKTFIMKQDDKDIDLFIHKPNREVDQIDSLLESKKLLNIQKALPLLRKLTLKQIRKNKTHEREFRFCIYRLEKVARCDSIKKEFNFKGITESIIEELLEQPYSVDIFARYLKSVHLTKRNLSRIKEIICDPEKRIYGWHIYNIWQILVYKNFKDQSLIDLAKSTIKKSRSEAEKAGACLYLGGCGSEYDREYVAICFSNLDSFLAQRNALIAVHELDYEKTIKHHVKPHVKKELVGTYKILKDNFNGTYIDLLPPVKPSELFREIQSHVS